MLVGDPDFVSYYDEDAMPLSTMARDGTCVRPVK